jgi:hypothetical protein
MNVEGQDNFFNRNSVFHLRYSKKMTESQGPEVSNQQPEAVTPETIFTHP